MKIYLSSEVRVKDTGQTLIVNQINESEQRCRCDSRFPSESGRYYAFEELELLPKGPMRALL